MEKELITIIVSIYNGEKFLNECIDSIVNQTYKNLEIILVDDGSTDNSLKICNEYKSYDERVIVIHQKNSGVSVSRNNALAIAKGKYVCFIDQDDFIDIDYIKYLHDLIKNNDAEISVVPRVIYYKEGEKHYSEKRNINDIKCVTGEQAACDMLLSKMEIGPWSKMISKKLIDENELMFLENIFGGEGYDFSVESFAAAKRVVYGYKGIYNYRVDNFSSEMSKYRPRTFISSKTAVSIMKKRLYGKSKMLNRALNYAEWRVYVAFLDSLISSRAIKENINDYKELVKYSRKYAYRSFCANVSLKRKIKDLGYFISPTLVAKFNVKFRRKR